jgi:hypothetical protein
MFYGLVHLSIWTKPFIIFRENFKICSDWIADKADDTDVPDDFTHVYSVPADYISMIVTVLSNAPLNPSVINLVVKQMSKIILNT